MRRPASGRRSDPRESARVANDHAATHGSVTNDRFEADDALFEGRSRQASPRQLGAGAERLTPPGLPIPVLADATFTARGYGVVTPVDRDGRLAARSVVTLMGWSAGQAMDLTTEPGPIVVARTGRTLRINPRGYLRLPLAVRRRCRIAPGDRVLVVANQRHGELLVVPMAVLDDIVDAYRHSRDIEDER
ncbi:hypothetical protein [Micromonospora sp. Llam0]|uniref:hypothetical protein n=1 Tax=Micromonospora sp. Llam0 TaxID=2485143 RepID=UPI0011CEA7F2|nr:hypothetical protein [Micromonospora sp. Llam0]